MPKKSDIHAAWPAFCDSSELAVELAAALESARGDCTPSLSGDPVQSAAQVLTEGAEGALAAVSRTPSPQELVRAATALQPNQRLLLWVCAPDAALITGLAADLAIPSVTVAAEACSLVALARAPHPQPWRAGIRGLTAVDRARIEPALERADRKTGKLVSLGAGQVGWERKDAEPLQLGRVEHVVAALAALRAAEPGIDAQPLARPERDRERTQDILFGPRRTLSDPASKAALTPYGVPLPQEELCTSPSRAAAEAGRMGFPVRISLASPDLRVWDHPDLALDGVDNAARVRDVYRQLTTMAMSRTEGARVLGVTVSATRLARALLWVEAEPLPEQRVLARLGFADPHGAASQDATWTVLPAGPRAVERTLSRMRGSSLLIPESPGPQKRAREELCELLSRVAAFVDDFRGEVSRVRLHHVALLLDGSCEVREAAVDVSDAFERGLSG